MASVYVTHIHIFGAQTMTSARFYGRLVRLAF